MGRFEKWLWDHGGYDVEGPDAVSERERLDVLYSAQDAVIEAALDHPGPWPASPTRTHNIEVVDVDRYRGFALVSAAIAEDPTGHGPWLTHNVFERDEGTWRRLGGGGSGTGADPLLSRQHWGYPDAALKVQSKGWHRARDKRRSKVCDAAVSCAPRVSSVIVDRPSDRRIVDVSAGPGLIGIVWPEGSEPAIAAFDAEGSRIAVLAPGDLRYDDSWPYGSGFRALVGKARWAARATWHRLRHGQRSRGWFNYQPRKRL